MKCNDNKVLAISYLVSESLNQKELLKVIVLLIGVWGKENERERKTTR